MLALTLVYVMGAGAAADTPGSAAIGLLIERALHTTGREQTRAIEDIGQLGPDAKPAIPLLLSFLSSRDPEVRLSSAAALGNVGPIASDAVPRLAEALDDPVIRVRVYAALALSQMASVAQRAAPALIATMRLAPTDVETRALHNNAVYALRLIRPSRKNVSSLCDAIADPSGQVRYSAAVVLAAMGPEASGARSALKRALADPSPMVHDAAQRALAAIEGP
jgi:HEAT repeat protein